MLAMSLLLCCSSPRPSRPRWRSAGRRRSMTHPSRAGAQRRMAAVRLSWLARGMGEAQGKKVSPPPLRPRRSRRSRPLARSSHQRPRGSPGPTAVRIRRGRYRVTRTRGQARRAKEKKHWRTDGRPRHVRTRQHSACMGDLVASELIGPHRSRCNERAEVTRERSKIGSVNHPRNHERRKLSSAWPATSADQAMSRQR
jgi:hypothetical protein